MSRISVNSIVNNKHNAKGLYINLLDNYSFHWWIWQYGVMLLRTNTHHAVSVTTTHEYKSLDRFTNICM